MNASFQLMPLEQLRTSDTRSQVERRERYDQGALQELADSIAAVGLLQPIVARPRAVGHCEIVAGERRFLAAKLAGLAEVPVNLRELTDEQCLEVQLVENLQREDLHELAEAEGYEGLLGLGHTADDLAAKFSKSKAYVYGRLKLLALCPAARKAFYDGDITASVALLLARIPTAKLQAEALKMVGGDSWDGPMTARHAAEHVQRRFMLRLKDAPFKPGDALLVPTAGACTTCPKRTGNQPELFEDVNSADVCTDTTCFESKRVAFSAQRIAKAEQDGRRVIAGAEAKAIVGGSYGTVEHSTLKGFVRVDDRCNQDEKYRSYRKVLGAKAMPPTALLVDPKDPTVMVEVIDRKALNAALTAKGVSKPEEPERRANGEMTRGEIKLETAYRARLHELVRASAADFGPRSHMGVEVAMRLFGAIDHDQRKRVIAIWGWHPDTAEVISKADDDESEDDGWDDEGDDEPYVPTQYVSPETILVRAKVEAMDWHEIDRFMTDLVFVDQLAVNGYGSRKATRLVDEAKVRGIDAEAVRKEVTDAAAVKKPRAKKVKEPA